MAQKKQGGILRIQLDDKQSLYQRYMSFVHNGGLFIESKKARALGEEVFLLLILPETGENVPVAGKVVWVTPSDAQGNRKPGFGVQFKDNGSARHKIESILATKLKSEQTTDTM